MLEAVAADLARFEVLVTYNGKASTGRSCGQVPPERRARRRARPPPRHAGPRAPALAAPPRHRAPGRDRGIHARPQRTGDLHSWMVPEAYFHFIHEGRQDLMDRILYHNALDIVTLAALTGLGGAQLAGEEVAGFRTDPIAMAKLAENRRDPAGAAHEYRRALDAGMKPAEARELLPKMARLYRRAGDHANAAWALEELLSRTRGLYLDAYEPLARLSERQLSDPAAAREWCVKGLGVLSRGLAALGGRWKRCASACAAAWPASTRRRSGGEPAALTNGKRARSARVPPRRARGSRTRSPGGSLRVIVGAAPEAALDAGGDRDHHQQERKRSSARTGMESSLKARGFVLPINAEDDLVSTRTFFLARLAGRTPWLNDHSRCWFRFKDSNTDFEREYDVQASHRSVKGSGPGSLDRHVHGRDRMFLL